MKKINTHKVINYEAIHVISSPESDLKELCSSPEENLVLASTTHIPFDIAQDLETQSSIQSSPSKNLSQKFNREVQQASSRGKDHIKTLGGSASQQLETPMKNITPIAEENTRIRLVNLQRKIVTLRKKENKYRALFQYVREVNHQIRETNLHSYSWNEEMKQKKKEIAMLLNL